ncbi:ankyrin repeat-containing protein ITN1-like isoform X2 [Andrographis paniculata]|uniref:ankyrin repeat-containing protein ITN1-like isoform X2 n=1 Tax=Andrographis paniculata TaxID=175694 RepID=UPI0021E7990D|nr:ankyrin repeat-containing protein ITN1-like isoform X2 [Andrographis paniculata]
MDPPINADIEIDHHHHPSAELEEIRLIERIAEELFKSAFEDTWNKVVELYRTQELARRVKINKSGDTAIHVAIAANRPDIVTKLVSFVSPADIEIQNDMGNTPLHLAAVVGNVEMCDCIARKNRSLIGQPNSDNETPFYLTALHGKKEAFLRLYSLIEPDRDPYAYCPRKQDGETILHAAIDGEHFDLAFEIMNRYPKFIHSVNEDGNSMLHLLANKPNAFRSGSRITGINELMYHCTFVTGLQQKSSRPEDDRSCSNLCPWNFKRGLTRRSDLRAQPDTESARDEALGDPKNGDSYCKCINVLRCLYSIWNMILYILGFGLIEIQKIRDRKQRHVWSYEILKKIVAEANCYEYRDNGRQPLKLKFVDDQETRPYVVLEGADVGLDESSLDRAVGEGDHDRAILVRTDGTIVQREVRKRESAFLIAAKNGIIEMVTKILETFPMAIRDTDYMKKNAVLVAVENRQPHVYQYLVKQSMKEVTFRATDKNGNSALHLAAALSETQPWRIPGAALQMQWEIKWYKGSMGHQFFVRHNKDGLTAKEVFTIKHEDMVQKGGQWLTNTSASCSVVAALVATVAFATSTAVPGGIDQQSGTPTLENQPAFMAFAICSLAALCFSVTSLVMFLSILTSRYQEKDFGKGLPKQLLAGLSSLFVSIAAVLVSFCAGHFFVLKQKLQNVAYLMYAITCLPITFFALLQFPLYYDLLKATLTKVPQRSYK